MPGTLDFIHDLRDRLNEQDHQYMLLVIQENPEDYLATSLMNLHGNDNINLMIEILREKANELQEKLNKDIKNSNKSQPAQYELNPQSNKSKPKKKTARKKTTRKNSKKKNDDGQQKNK